MCLSLQPFTKEAMETFFARSLMLRLCARNFGHDQDTGHKNDKGVS